MMGLHSHRIGNDFTTEFIHPFSGANEWMMLLERFFLIVTRINFIFNFSNYCQGFEENVARNGDDLAVCAEKKGFFNFAIFLVAFDLMGESFCRENKYLKIIIHS